MLPLRQLPAIDTLLRAAELQGVIDQLGLAGTKSRLRGLQDEWRRTGAAPEWANHAKGYAAHLQVHANTADYESVFNMTGTLIHTNLGRAPVADSVLTAMANAARGNLSLEFDLNTGRRGSRDQPVTQRLAALTGAEAATGSARFSRRVNRNWWQLPLTGTDGARQLHAERSWHHQSH